MPFGEINKKYVSSISILGQDNSITTRNLLESILDVTREEPQLLEVMEMLGRMEATTTPYYSNAVNEELYAIFTINGAPTDNSGGSGQGDVTVVVTDTDGTARIRPGDLVMAASGYVGYVYGVTPDAGGDQIDIKAVNPAITTALLGFADTQKFTVFGRADGEGSRSPSAVRYGLTTYYNQTQSIKNKFEITDIEGASQIDFTYDGQPYYLIKGQHEAWLRAKGDVSFTMIMGQISDPNFKATAPTLEDAAGNPVQTTRGLDEYVANQGVDIPAADVTLALYEIITGEMKTIRAPKQYFVWMGHEQNVAHDNMLNALTAAAQFSPNARIMIDGKELDLGIDRWRLYGYEFLKMDFDILNHRNVTRFDGSAKFNERAYYVPTDKIRTAGGGGQVDRIRIRYQEMPGVGNFQWREWMTGALAPNQTDDETKLNIHYHCIMGLECLGVEHFLRTKLT